MQGINLYSIIDSKLSPIKQKGSKNLYCPSKNRAISLSVKGEPKEEFFYLIPLIGFHVF